METGYELFIATTQRELHERIDRAHQRFTDLLRAADPALPLPRSQWSVADVAGHVLTVLRRYRGNPTLGDTPRDVDRINAEELAALGTVPLAELLEEIDRELKLFRDTWSTAQGLTLTDPVPFHGGAAVDIAAALSNIVGEFLIHGYDVAAATGVRWPIDPLDARLILNGVLQIVPAYAVRSATERLRMRLDVAGAHPWVLDFDRGRLTSRRATEHEPVDVAVRAPADVLVLSLYSRLTPMQAARRRLLVVGGRRPWKVLRLSRLIEQP